MRRKVMKKQAAKRETPKRATSESSWLRPSAALWRLKFLGISADTEQSERLRTALRRMWSVTGVSIETY